MVPIKSWVNALIATLPHNQMREVVFFLKWKSSCLNNGFTDTSVWCTSRAYTTEVTLPFFQYFSIFGSTIHKNFCLGIFFSIISNGSKICVRVLNKLHLIFLPLNRLPFPFQYWYLHAISIKIVSISHPFSYFNRFILIFMRRNAIGLTTQGELARAKMKEGERTKNV